MTETRHLLFIGLGYSARHVAAAARAKNWLVSGTTRSPEKLATISEQEIQPVIWSEPLILPMSILTSVTDIVVSAAPEGTTCPVLGGLSPFLHNFSQLRSIVYYSSTGVYGDRDGGWVDEDSPTEPGLARGKNRLAAEAAWQAACTEHQIPLFTLRLSGIYGPGRNGLETLLRQTATGEARRVYREGQIFNRIHVDDIAAITVRLLEKTDGPALPRGTYNLADDQPSPPEEVVAYAAELLGLPVPPLVPHDEAGLSPMGMSFYAESKRIRNDAIKADLGYTFKYPGYREGLQALLPTVNQGN